MTSFFNLRSLALATFALVGLAASQEASAQFSTVSQPIRYGAEAGLNRTTLTSGTTDFSGIGFHFGGVADIPVARQSALVARLGYERKQASHSTSTSDGRVDADITLNFIDLSAVVRHNATERLIVQGGLSMQFDAGGSKGSVSVANGTTSREIMQRGGEMAVPTQFGLVGGLGYRFQATPEIEVIPTITYTLGLSSPTRDGNGSSNTLRVGARMLLN